jgi:hypothetical protein
LKLDLNFSLPSVFLHWTVKVFAKCQKILGQEVSLQSVKKTLGNVLVCRMFFHILFAECFLSSAFFWAQQRDSLLNAEKTLGKPFNTWQRARF